MASSLTPALEREAPTCLFLSPGPSGPRNHQEQKGLECISGPHPQLSFPKKHGSGRAAHSQPPTSAPTRDVLAGGEAVQAHYALEGEGMKIQQHSPPASPRFERRKYNFTDTGSSAPVSIQTTLNLRIGGLRKTRSPEGKNFLPFTFLDSYYLKFSKSKLSELSCP